MPTTARVPATKNDSAEKRRRVQALSGISTVMTEAYKALKSYASFLETQVKAEQRRGKTEELETLQSIGRNRLHSLLADYMKECRAYSRIAKDNEVDSNLQTLSFLVNKLSSAEGLSTQIGLAKSITASVLTIQEKVGEAIQGISSRTN